MRARLTRQPVVEFAELCVPLADGTCAALDPHGRRATRLPAQATKLHIGVRLADRGLGIGDIDAFVNDRNAGRFAAPAAEDGKASTTIDVPLDPGQNTIQLRVYDKSDTVFVETQPLDLANRRQRRRRAWQAVRAGSRHRSFRRASLSLNYAVADAQTFVRVVQRSAERLFPRWRSPSCPTQQATRAGILDAFDRLPRASGRTTRSCSTSRAMACAARTMAASC